MVKKHKKIVNVIAIFILIIGITVLSKKQSNNIIEETSLIPTSTAGLSNEKIEWGISRKSGNVQPDLGSDNLEVLEKYNGIAMGNSEDNSIYLTFDLGYEAGYTESILDTLKENEVSAAFFLTAHYINTNEELVQRMIDEGHTIGNHTTNHYSMPELTDEEIYDEVMSLHVAVSQKFDYEMKYIRPPMGEFSETSIVKTNTLRIYNSNVVFCIC